MINNANTVTSMYRTCHDSTNTFTNNLKQLLVVYSRDDTSEMIERNENNEESGNGKKSQNRKQNQNQSGDENENEYKNDNGNKRENDDENDDENENKNENEKGISNDEKNIRNIFKILFSHENLNFLKSISTKYEIDENIFKFNYFPLDIIRSFMISNFGQKTENFLSNSQISFLFYGLKKYLKSKNKLNVLNCNDIERNNNKNNDDNYKIKEVNSDINNDNIAINNSTAVDSNNINVDSTTNTASNSNTQSNTKMNINIEIESNTKTTDSNTLLDIPLNPYNIHSNPVTFTASTALGLGRPESETPILVENNIRKMLRINDDINVLVNDEKEIDNHTKLIDNNNDVPDNNNSNGNIIINSHGSMNNMNDYTNNNSNNCSGNNFYGNTKNNSYNNMTHENNIFNNYHNNILKFKSENKLQNKTEIDVPRPCTTIWQADDFVLFSSFLDLFQSTSESESNQNRVNEIQNTGNSRNKNENDGNKNESNGNNGNYPVLTSKRSSNCHSKLFSNELSVLAHYRSTSQQLLKLKIMESVDPESAVCVENTIESNIGHTHNHFYGSNVGVEVNVDKLDTPHTQILLPILTSTPHNAGQDLPYIDTPTTTLTATLTDIITLADIDTSYHSMMIERRLSRLALIHETLKSSCTDEWTSSLYRSRQVRVQYTMAVL